MSQAKPITIVSSQSFPKGVKRVAVPPGCVFSFDARPEGDFAASGDLYLAVMPAHDSKMRDVLPAVQITSGIAISSSCVGIVFPRDSVLTVEEAR